MSTIHPLFYITFSHVRSSSLIFGSKKGMPIPNIQKCESRVFISELESLFKSFSLQL